jgi:uncharacterized protein YndB with AHSA1/START domain
MEMLAVERAAWINANREHVRRAITDPEQLKQWYAPGCPWEIPALQVGTTVKFYNTDTDIQLAKIEVVEPLQEFTLRWKLDEADPDTTLINTFRLEEENGGTRVTATQAGYKSLPEGMRQQQLDQDEEAYTAIVESLKAYVERSNP